MINVKNVIPWLWIAPLLLKFCYYIYCSFFWGGGFFFFIENCEAFSFKNIFQSDLNTSLWWWRLMPCLTFFSWVLQLIQNSAYISLKKMEFLFYIFVQLNFVNLSLFFEGLMLTTSKSICSTQMKHPFEFVFSSSIHCFCSIESGM